MCQRCASCVHPENRAWWSVPWGLNALLLCTPTIRASRTLDAQASASPTVPQVLTVKSVSPDGQTVTVNEVIKFNHYGGGCGRFTHAQAHMQVACG